MPLSVRIVGEGELEDQLRRQVTDAGLDDVVSMPGSRSQAELVEELARADVLVAPCVLGADGNADGLPTVILEAMASGVPCIATDVTGIPEAVHPATSGNDEPQTGILLAREREGLADRLAAALRELADPSWPRVEVARAARAAVERDFDSARQALLLASQTQAVAR